jgi:hypothetical protein
MDHLRETLLRLRKNLNILQEREAKHANNAPLDLLNQIKDHRTAIGLTEQALAGEITEAEWREALRPLLVHIRDQSEAHPEWGVNLGDIDGDLIGNIIVGRDISAGGDIVTGVKQTATGQVIAQAGPGGTATVNYYESPLAVASKSGRCDYYSHINLPPNFVPRRELLDTLKQTLLTGSQDVALTSKLKMSALHGMGGIGKSVLARALCDEPEVQARFSDGILWTTLGQTLTEDDLKTKLRAWIETLGGIIGETAPSLDQLKNNLAGQLKERACLLIVDDMWRYPEAAWFNAGGPACRLLLTTRDAEAAHQLGATIAPVSEMTEAEAITLLEEWAGRPLSQSEPDLTTQIVKRLDYLPLALKLAGEQLRRQEPDRWLANFSTQKLKSRRDETVHGNLFDTFALSLNDLPTQEQSLYLSLAIFKEDEPIPPQAITLLWSQLDDDYDPADTEDLLADLADRALLQLHDNWTVSLHDLVRDFMAEKLPAESQQQAHAALLTGYRATQQGQGWPTTSDDGYLYAHLAYHLDALAAHDEAAAGELKQLFADDRWLHARVPADDYRYDGYLADLDLVWQRAERQAKQQLEADQAPEAISDLVHYALIQTSINSLAGQYPPALVARAVETRLWSMERAISVARKVVKPGTRAEICRRLLAVGPLPQEQINQLSQLGLTAVQAIGDEWSRVEVLTTLAPHLTGTAQTQALAEALRAAQPTGDGVNLAYALLILAPYLSGELLAEALRAAQTIGDGANLAHALTSLAPHLTGELLAESLRAAQTIGDEWSRVEVLTTLAPHLTGTAQTQALAETLQAALAIDDGGHRFYALTSLAPHLTGTAQTQALAEALWAAQAIGNERERAAALTRLAPHLTGELLAEALRTINMLFSNSVLTGLVPHLSGQQLAESLRITPPIGDEGYRAAALTRLALHLTGSTKKRALAEALRAAQAIGNERERAEVLTTLAPHLTGAAKERALDEALRAAQAIGNERERAEVLTTLAPHLTGSTKERALAEALRAAQAIGNERKRAEVLTTLAPHLMGSAKERALDEALRANLAEVLRTALVTFRPDVQAKVLTVLAPYLNREQLAEAPQVALAIENAVAKALTALAPYLAGDLLAEVLRGAQTIGDKLIWVRALMALAPHLTGSAKERALVEALRMAQAINDEQERVEVLTTLAPHLTSDFLDEFLQIVQAIGNERKRAEVLATIALHLTGSAKERALDEALRAAQAIGNERERVEVLTTLAPHLTGEQLAVALRMAQAIGDEVPRFEALTALAPYLTGTAKGHALTEALRAAQVIDERVRGRALTILASHLTGTVKEPALAEALRAAQAIGNEGSRAEALTGLAPHLTGEQLAEALRAAQAIGNEGSRAEALTGLAPHLSGEQLAVALRVAQAIGEEGSRADALIGLVPHLTGEQLAEALRAAQAIDNERGRVEVLTTLAPHLTGEQLAEVLRAAQAIGNEGSRAEALIGLVPHLTGQQLAEALRAAQAIDNERERVEVLTTLAPHLTGEQLAEALRAAQAIGNEGSRAEALTGLAPHLTGEQLAEALRAAQAIGNEGSRAEALTGLAPHLTGEQLAEVLRAAQAIGEEGSRADALIGLAPHLTGEQLAEVLRAAQAIGDERSRAAVLTRLVPHLTGTAQAQALAEGLEAAQAIGKAWGNVLAHLAPHLPSATVRDFVVTELGRFRRVNRSELLDLLSQEALFNRETLGLSAEAMAAISGSIIEVCGEWRWL